MLQGGRLAGACGMPGLRRRGDVGFKTGFIPLLINLPFSSQPPSGPWLC